MFAISVMLLAATPAYPFGPTPIGDPERWVLPEDYPMAAIRADKGGIQIVEISVDKTGRPARCDVVLRTGFRALDQAGCQALMTRGQWQPSVDAKGEPIYSVYRRLIRWVIPGTTPLPYSAPADLDVEVQKLPIAAEATPIVVKQIQQADGSVEDCSIVSPSSSADLNRVACRVATPLAAQGPILDKNGNRVKGARWWTIRFLEKAMTGPKR